MIYSFLVKKSISFLAINFIKLEILSPIVPNSKVRFNCDYVSRPPQMCIHRIHGFHTGLLAVIIVDLTSFLLLLLIASLMKPGQYIRTFTEAVEHYAQLGLRTLCLAWRELKEDEYREWSLMFKEASSTLVDREVTQHLTIILATCFD